MSQPRPAIFAVPGDPGRMTGGTIYDRRLLDALRAEGRDVTPMALPEGFPDPGAAAMEAALDRLAAVPPDHALIVDGLAHGALDTDGLRRLRAPVCVMHHHPLSHEPGLPADRARTLAARERANLAHAAHVVVPSGHVAALLRGEFGVPDARLSIAPPGFDRPREGPAPAPDEPPLILSVGLMARRKGHDVLMRALARIADLDWRAEIVGKPHEPGLQAELRRLRADLGLGARLRLRDGLDAEPLGDRYRAATLFALATRYEGYGMVFGEAMSHGLPIVSCRAGAVPDTVPEAAGLLVAPDAPEAFAAALRRMLTEPATRRNAARAATVAGRALPGWDEAARIMGAALDRIAP